MPNATGTATTWQDNHSGYRRHKLMTKELGEKIPALGANENVEDFDDVLAPAKMFSPLQQLDLVRHRVGRRDRAVLRPRRGVRDGAWLLLPRRAGGGDRVRRRPRRGARPVLEADDPRRDQEGRIAPWYSAATDAIREETKEDR